MDGYVPAFLGGMAGAAVGMVLVLVGVGSLVMARRQRRLAVTLSG